MLLVACIVALMSFSKTTRSVVAVIDLGYYMYIVCKLLIVTGPDFALHSKQHTTIRADLYITNIVYKFQRQNTTHTQ